MQAFFALAAVLLLANQANGFGWGLLGGGGGCGCSAPPACAPPPPPICAPPPAPICAPQPQACPPPPPPPPPQVCPQPQPCPICQPPPPPQCPPPPPPPAPCPPPPPQQVCPPQQPIQQPIPQYQSCAPPPPPAHNDCCNQCNSPCRFRSRRVFGAILQRDATAMCNNDKLRSIMLENFAATTSESKRAIQKAAEEKLGGKYDVICATGEFSYVVHSNSFCQQTVNTVTCYAFRH